VLGGPPPPPPHTGRLQNEYCEYAASAVYIIHEFYMNDIIILCCIKEENQLSNGSQQ
jgi:hypothetical protein